MAGFLVLFDRSVHVLQREHLVRRRRLQHALQLQQRHIELLGNGDISSAKLLQTMCTLTNSQQAGSTQQQHFIQ